jgi:Ricin-type beta-trefoil lectin domain
VLRGGRQLRFQGRDDLRVLRPAESASGCSKIVRTSVDTHGYGTANGTKVQLWACTGAANQKWDTRNWRIHYDNPAAVNKVLDDTGHGGNGTQQQIWTNTGGTNQIWATS